jgi:hypothetical protein
VITVTLTGRAEALFASSLQPSERPSQPEIMAAIRASLQAHHGIGGCAAALAEEFGEHPETAVCRMRWALAQVA